jgi:hypothetical protein
VGLEGSTAGGYQAPWLIFLAEYFTALKILFTYRRAYLVVANLMKAAMDER